MTDAPAGERVLRPRARDQVDRARAARRFAAWLNGAAEGAIPDTYGLKVEALVASMEEWRGRHGPEADGERRSVPFMAP